METPFPYSAGPAKREDIEEIWRLMVDVNLAEAGTPGFGLTEIENWLTGEPIVIGEDVLVVRDDSGAIVGVEIVDSRPPFVRPHAIGGVHPDHVGRGIGHAMLTWAQTRSMERIDEAPPAAKVLFLTFTAGDHEHSAQTMRNFGLEMVRYFLDMEIEFEAKPPHPVVPDGLTIRLFDPETELDALAELTTDGFRDHYGFVEGPLETRIEWLRHWMTQSDHDPSLWWVVEDGDQLVGFNLCEPANEGREEVGYVASLAVLPTHRGRGLGRALLLTAFNRFYEMGKTGAGLGVDADSLTGATRLYESVGMSPGSRYALWEKVLRDGEDLATRELDA